MASLGRELDADTAPSPELVVPECASDLPPPKNPTILWLGSRTRTLFADDPSLAKGVRYYDGDSTSVSWPDYLQSKAHRLHDIPTLCSICNSLDLDALSSTGSKLRYSLSNIFSAVKHCRFCALIVQGVRANSLGSVAFEPVVTYPGCETVLEVSFVKGWLIIVETHVFFNGEFQQEREVGRFKVISGGDAEDTQPADFVDMLEEPATTLITAQERKTDVSIYRLMSELERVIINTSRCQACAPSSLPMSEQNGLPTRLEALPFLPDRVVEILSPLGTPAGQMLLRLKEADGREAALYTALSHRWGGDRTLKTTKTTVRKHLQGFTMQELPRTFQDAALISLALGIKHVWIDSLCIIQDDVNDWLRQAAKMGSIYSHSTFTIAAHSASQCNEGFLWRCQVSSTMGVTPLTGGPAFTVEIPEINGKSLIGARFFRSEISDRAWVLQELTLSPRILHFYENRLFWECEHSHSFPEQFGDGPNSDDPVSRNVSSAALFLDARNSLGLHDAWLQLVNRYSACKLTNNSDRLVAIAGIANALQQGLSGIGSQAKHDYHCGIIEADVHRLLLWYLRSEDILSEVERHPRRAHAPSWSWASADHTVEFTALSFKHVRPPVKHMRLQGRRHQDYTDPAAVNPSCRLLLQAPVIRVFVQLEIDNRRSPPPPLPTYMAFQLYFDPVAMKESPAASQLVGWCWPDAARLWPRLGEMIVEHLAFLVVQSNDSGGSYRLPGAWCLMITPVQGGGDGYERVGIAFICESYVEKALDQFEVVSLV